jgi:transposase, IS5 family
MRRQEQLPLTATWIDHPHAKELEAISRILEEESGIAKLIEQDLVQGVKNPHTGAQGMSGDQVLRVLLIKQLNRYSYDELHFHLKDSRSYRAFCRLGALEEEVPSRSTLAENLKKVRAETLEKVNRCLLGWAKAKGIENGKKVRVDSTVVETNIHEPSDSKLLYDGVRVLARLLGRAKQRWGFAAWQDHTRCAKRRMRAIADSRKAEERTRLYEDLLEVSRKTLGYARAARVALKKEKEEDKQARRLLRKLAHFCGLLRKVIAQTERRVLKGEQVPAAEKVVSLFEPHTDVLVKDRRETQYGHKVNLTGGASGLLLDCVIEEGNPADASRCTPMLRRQKEIYGVPPQQAALDGGYASKENLQEAKAEGVPHVCFTKKRGLAVEEMTGSQRLYRALQRFRAGIEGGISYLKRVFGMGRCTWRGELSFGTYVWSTLITANLLTLARHVLG